MYDIREIRQSECSWLKSIFFYTLYSQLTECSLLEKNEFEDWFNTVQNNPCFKLFGVITSNQKLVGLGSIYIFTKYYRNKGKSAYLEDLIIDKEHRHRGLGKKIIEKIIHKCKELHCYKLQLNCIPELKQFYNSTGFKNKVIGMEIRFQ